MPAHCVSAYIMHNYISPVLLILPRIPHIIGIFLTFFRVSFRIFVKGGGKYDNSRVKGGKDYSMFSV